MMKANKDNVLFIKAGDGFFREGATGDGYMVECPYYEHNIFERIMREICFRIPVLPRRQWYNKSICCKKIEYVIVSDPLVSRDYLKWLKKQFPTAQLNFTYGNMVGKAKHLMPTQIPTGWRIWTYDAHDAQKYGIRLFRSNPYFNSFIRGKEKIEYDVIFVGKDKGRGEYLLRLEEKMQELGLRTKFIIAPDGRFAKKKKYYQNPISYQELIKLIIRSRSILNVAMDGQEGMTMRDLESLFFRVKLLTTNKHIVRNEIYYPENVYIIDGLNINDLPLFLEKEMVEVPESVKRYHSLEYFIDEITATE